MKLAKLALLLLSGVGAGCASAPPATPVALSELPNCYDANFDKERALFTIKSDVGSLVNQQCLLTVGARGDTASPQRLSAGSYRVYLSNGGGGGAGGTMQPLLGGSGGGGGGGAGAAEAQVTVNLTEGIYKLTLGAGGEGGSVCLPAQGFGGGPGGLGSPSSMIRVATGELVAGTPGADNYTRPSRSQNERMSGKADGHGGYGPGQTSGGHGSVAASNQSVGVNATPGAGRLASGRIEPGGTAGHTAAGDNNPGGGGGGGATRIGLGGDGGGESPGQNENLPERGSLGSGGGGGEGSLSQCDPGARGGHGYIAARAI